MNPTAVAIIGSELAIFVISPLIIIVIIIFVLVIEMQVTNWLVSGRLRVLQLDFTADIISFADCRY